MLSHNAKLDLKAILTRAEIKPMTSAAIKLTGADSGGTTSLAPDGEDQSSHHIFSVAELADFGSSKRVPSASQMLELRWIIAAKLIQQARTAGLLR